MKSFIYWNIRRKLWSIQQQGRVIDHTTSLVLENPMFCVSEAGRQRVLREGRKNVHAKVIGKRVPANGWRRELCNIRVRYNPYRDKTFVSEGGVKVTQARLAYFNPDGTVYAYSLQ
jgi:hypothetical protein